MLNLKLTYYNGSVTRPREGPVAENAMQWLGSFFRKPKANAWVYARFSKRSVDWRSRFNLPFKVTMTGSGVEVVIDGISMDLPKNPLRAIHGWLNKLGERVETAVLLYRAIEFSKFKINQGISNCDAALSMFMEEVKP